MQPRDMLDAWQQQRKASVFLSEFDLTHSQWAALQVLLTDGRCTMRVFAQRMNLAQSTVTRLLGPLKRRGLVLPTPGQDDARYTQVHITEEGRALLRRIKETADQREAEEGWDEDEIPMDVPA